MLKLQYKNIPGRSLWLVGERVTIGGEASNDIVIADDKVKALHAEILISAKGLVLCSDPGSCLVNKLPVDGEYSLSVNDEIRIGHQLFELIDPKLMLTEETLFAPVAVPEPNPSNWELVPEHSKLQQQDFLIRNRATLGRAKFCDFSIPYKLLSREHARFFIEDGELRLQDLDSANGCFVNGERVFEAVLKDGDRVAFAKLGFVVRAAASSGMASIHQLAPVSKTPEVA